MKISLTKDTFIAFLTVVALAGMALGLADETEAALNPQAMAKLGIHKMPNGEWMQGVEPEAANDAAPAGVDHSGHGAQPEAPDENAPARDQSPPAEQAPQQMDHEMPGGMMMDHEAMGH